LKIWALVFVVVVVVGLAWLCFALLCLQFQTHFIKRRSRGVMVSTQMDLTSPLSFQAGGCHAAFLRNNENFPWGLATLLFAGTFKV
jgi:hypothetical protein